MLDQFCSKFVTVFSVCFFFSFWTSLSYLRRNASGLVPYRPIDYWIKETSMNKHGPSVRGFKGNYGCFDEVEAKITNIKLCTGVIGETTCRRRCSKWLFYETPVCFPCHLSVFFSLMCSDGRFQ